MNLLLLFPTFIILMTLPMRICLKVSKGAFVTQYALPKTIGGLNKQHFEMEKGDTNRYQEPIESKVKVKKQRDKVRLNDDLKDLQAASLKWRMPTTGLTLSVKHFCDNLALYCLRSYQTGRICARTNYYIYETFRNYCMMDYVNCCELYEVWQIVHMGECYVLPINEELVPYSYLTDSFLDGYYWQDGTVD